LIREVKAAGHLKAHDGATIEALMAEAKPISEKVTILRHKAIAHRSAHISYNEVFKLAAVKPNQLRDLTNIALKVANHILLAYGLQEQHFTELPRSAAEAMMQALGNSR
jgi:hypothetical protein